MSKIKLTIGLFAYSLIFLLAARPAKASVLSIQTLPSYINTNSFKLSCTTDAATAQFSVSKHGGAFVNFGPVIDTTANPCIVQVTSSEVNDQTDYVFSVNGGPTTSTTYDTSGPSPVSGYYKERASDGSYKLHWKNPGDTDFDKVIIYRGDTADFSADNSHEIARVSGSPNSDMTYDDNFAPDPNKTYFYDIRAVDHAGNSSSLVGDGGTTTGSTTTSTATPKPSSGKVTTLPVEQANGGSVLGTEAAAAPQASLETTPAAGTQTGNLFAWILGHKKLSLGVALGLIVIGYLLFRKKKS